MLRLSSILMMTVALVGCADSPESEKQFDGGTSSSVILDIDSDRETVEGRWQMLFYSDSAGQPVPTPMTVALIEIEPDEGGYKVKVLDRPKDGPQVQVAQSSIQDQDATISLEAVGAELTFEGHLSDSRMRGSLTMMNSMSFPAEMLPTSSPVIGESSPLSAVGEYEEALRSEDRGSALARFAAEYPASPLSLFALERAISELSKDSDAATIAARVSAYREKARQWGGRMELTSMVNAGFGLTAVGIGHDQVDSLITEVRATFEDGQVPPAMTPVLGALESRAKLSRADSLLDADDTDTQQAGIDILQAMLDENPYTFDAILRLADHAVLTDDKQAAIHWYGRLVVLPAVQQMLIERMGSRMEGANLPLERVRRLWQQQHGNTDELEPWLMNLYREIIYEAGVKDVELPEPGNRVVVCELFTGSSCPPCVAADVATGIAEQKYPHENLYVLRYHQHIPAPDPLVCPEGESRFDYYSPQGTPSLFINGKSVEASGPIVLAKTVFDAISEQITPELSKSTELKIELSAQSDGSVVDLSASVQAAEPLSENLRLRLVIAEDEVPYPAPNGIAIHEMVVRDMPGGADGVAVQDGKLEFQQRVDLAEVRQEILDYLRKFEVGRRRVFPIKPLELQKFHLIAMVQDESTREVLQANRVSFQVKQPPLKIPGKDDQETGGPTDASQPSAGSSEASPPNRPESDSAAESSPPTASPAPPALPEAATSTDAPPSQD